MRLLHIITGLQTGGAEMMLFKLLDAMHAAGFDAAVLSLMPPGPVGERISILGIPVYSLNVCSGMSSLTEILRMRRLVREIKPDVIQGWMYHGNLAAWFAHRWVNRAPVVWNIRQSLYEIHHEKRLTRWVIRLGAALSSRVQAIVYNSHTSRPQHEAAGYDRRHALVIPNGFDLDRFKSSPERRLVFRKALKVDADVPLVGMVARWHPMKDHANFLRAAARVLERFKDVHFVLAGRGIDADNAMLMDMIGSLKLADRVHLLGEVSDVAVVMATLDVLVSASSSEAFSNVLGEGMACGVPCVATDVGDSAKVLDGHGRIVPPHDPAAMAAAVIELLHLDRHRRVELGAAARLHVEENFSISEIADRYAALYEKLANKA
jgi:glycosyltransferase involved in cell wall biosynthesis